MAKAIQVDLGGGTLTDEQLRELRDGLARWAEHPGSRVPETRREPMKFEAGQVVRVVEHDEGRIIGDTARVVARVSDGMIWCCEPRNLLYIDRYSTLSDCHRFAVLSPAPRAGDTWTSGESVVFIHSDSTTNLRIVSEGEPFVGDVVAVARRLWEGGYRRVGYAVQPENVNVTCAGVAGPKTFRWSLDSAGRPNVARDDLKALIPTHGEATRELSFEERVDATTPQSPLDGLVISSPNAAQWTTNASEGQILDDIKTMVREQAQKWVDRGVLGADAVERVRGCVARCVERGDSVGDAARNIQSILDSTRVDRANDDGLRKLAEVYGVPGLRAGMVVRDDSRGVVKEFGLVTSIGHDPVAVKWRGDDKIAWYSLPTVRDHINAGRWRIVTPDVAPLASLANAVAAIFAQPDRATSRRYIDIACAQLRGEPFAEAIRAALVGVADRVDLSPAEIVACIAALQHWETHRPFDRDLVALKLRTNDWRAGGPWNRLQSESNAVLVGELGYRPTWDHDSMYFVYERARASR